MGYAVAVKTDHRELPRLQGAGGSLALANVSEQFVGSSQKGIGRIPFTGTITRGIAGDKLPAAMLTDDFSAEVFDANLQPPTARGTLLKEVRAV